MCWVYKKTRGLSESEGTGGATTLITLAVYNVGYWVGDELFSMEEYTGESAEYCARVAVNYLNGGNKQVEVSGVIHDRI